VSLPPRQHELYRALIPYLGRTQQSVAEELEVRASSLNQILRGARRVPPDPPAINGDDLGDVEALVLPYSLDFADARKRAENGVDLARAREHGQQPKPRRLSRAVLDAELVVDLGGDDDPYVFAVVRLVEPPPAVGQLPFKHYNPPVAFSDNVAGRNAADEEAARRGDNAVVVLMTAPGIRA
jgi:hypothetical protein